MELIITFLRIVGLAFIISRFEPLQWIWETLTQMSNNILLLALSVSTTCMKCLSLWIGIISGHFWLGVIASIFSMVYEKYLSKWERVKAN